MPEEDKPPTFTERTRLSLAENNGTLLITQLMNLTADDPAADIALWINSPGGSVPSMLAILSAGAAGKRYALPHVGKPHGKNAAQDAHRLRLMP
jgi:Clp protease